MVNYVDVYLESPVDEINETVTTGFTQNVNGVDVFYVVGRIYQKRNHITRRTLERHRQKAETIIPKQDLPLYFTCHNGAYMYSDRFKTFAKYKPEAAQPAQEQLTYEITAANLPFHGDLKTTLINLPWTFMCGVRSHYRNTLEISTSVSNMREAFRQIRAKYPGAEVTMFFTTEFNDHQNNDPDQGYHSHCVLHISGKGQVQLKREVDRILHRCGKGKSDVKNYRDERDGVGYITKFIRHAPDGWGIMSTSKKQIEIIYERTTGRTWIVKDKGENWLEKSENS